MNEIERHQASLKSLIVVQAASVALALIALYTFPIPEEVTAALTVMDEINPPKFGFWAFMNGLLILATIGLWGWSLWELYHLNQEGFIKFVWSTVLGFVCTFTNGGESVSYTHLTLPTNREV